MGRTAPLRIFLIFVHPIALWKSALSEPLGCQSPQTLELNKLGTIRCNLGSNIKKIFWYDSLEDGTQSSPIIVFNKGKNQTSGSGLKNHEYGITTEGNLVIMEVSWHHERRYRVICIGSDDTTSIHFVEVQVVVFSSQTFPVIYGCKEDPCINNFKSGEILTCSFTSARPPADLIWFENSTNGQNPIPFKLEVTRNRNGTFDTVAYTSVHFSDVDFIKFYTCKLDWLSPEWTKFAEIIAVSSSSYNRRNSKSYQYATLNGFAELRCSEESADFKIWKKLNLAGELEPVGSFWKSESKVEAKYVNSLHINKKGNLVFESIGFHHEGEYLCQYSKEYHDEVKVIALVPVVLPSPSYLQVKQCEDSDVCVTEQKESEILTCYLNGVYPDANLTWVPIDPSQVSFNNYQADKKTSGKLLDVSITSSYKFLRGIKCEEEVFVKCQVSGPVSELIKPSVTIKIVQDGPCYWLEKPNFHMNITVFSLSMIILVASVSGYLCGKYVSDKKKTTTTKYEKVSPEKNTDEEVSPEKKDEGESKC